MKKLFVNIFFLSLLMSMSFQLSAAANLGFGEFFSDVKDPYPYTYQIDWLADNGVLRGYDTGKFQPEKCVNRAEFLKMLYVTLERDLDDLGAGAGWASYFSDVNTEAWYWKYLRYALQTGSVQGYPDKTFRPDQCVKRVEAVKIATLEFHDGKVPAPRDALHATLADVAQDAWYSPMVAYAYNAGILGLSHTKKDTGGYSIRYFPDQGMTRGEVAYLLYMIKALKDNGLAANDSSLWNNDRSKILFNDERGILLPRMLSDVYAFDGCGKVADEYTKESWYAEWKAAVTAAGIDVTKIVDACYSREGGRLIFIVDEGYAKLSSLYKYTIPGVLEKAVYVGDPTLAVLGIPGFGKRTGNFIPLKGITGDAGWVKECTLEYYFGKNILELKKCKTISS